MARRTYDWGGGTLTREQTAQILHQAGFRGEALVNMVAIAGRESGYRPGIHGSDQPQNSLSGDLGLFQINYVNHNRLIQAGIINSPRDLFDPLTNARAAHFLSNGGSNLGPWTAGPGGWQAGGNPLYGTNVGAARTAVQNMGGGGGNANNNKPPQPSAIGDRIGGMFGGGGSQPLPPAAPNFHAPGTGVPYATPGPMQPDPSIAWLQNQVGAGNAYLNSQIGGLNAQLLQSSAFTQMQREAMEQQAAYDRQLIQNRAAGVGINEQSATTQQQYRNYLAQFQNQLIDIERAAADGNLGLAGQSFAELGRNSERLRQLASQGRTNTTEYLRLTEQLDRDVFNQAISWLGEQGAFNDRDLALTQQAIKDLMTTEQARFTELGRATTAERGLAGDRLSEAQTRGQREGDIAARATVQQRQEASLTAREAQRQTRSDATARGAQFSEGATAQQRFIQDQLGLANQNTDIQYAGAMEGIRGSYAQQELQFNRDMESIQQAYAAGQISFEDAQRQSANARERAQLTFDQNTGSIANQRAGANLTLRGAQLQTGNARSQAELQYQQQLESVQNAYNNGQISYQAAQQRYQQLTQQQDAERQRVGQEQQMQQRLYELQLQQYQLDREAYNTQDAQRQSELYRQSNELAYAQSQAIAQMNSQRMSYEAQRPMVFQPGGGGAPMVGSYGGGGVTGGGGGGGNANKPASSQPQSSYRPPSAAQPNKPGTTRSARNGSNSMLYQ